METCSKPQVRLQAKSMQHRTENTQFYTTKTKIANLPSLTLYLDLPAGALTTRQQRELFSLVHGIVCTSNYNKIAWFPGLLDFILQV